LGLVTFGGGRRHDRVNSPLDLDLSRTEFGLGSYPIRAPQISAELNSYVSFPALGFGTSITDGLRNSIEELDKSSRPAKRFIILMADGGQSKTLDRPDPLTEALIARSKGVEIITIGYSVGRAATLEGIAEVSGGESFRVDNPDELKEAFLEISRLFGVRLTQ